MNKVDDALDRRPGEKVRDAAEDVGHELDDAAKEIKESTKDVVQIVCIRIMKFESRF